ncbi:CARDB domain-containing protein [Streptomyces sp. NPDC089919]|uniref:CARDB domain-containing protein n=1 Tax=Streptomyces sp. NPDC089919 TaxID=3155188 RepID=UPI00341C4E54
MKHLAPGQVVNDEGAMGSMGKRKHRSSRKGVYIGAGAAMAAISFAVLPQASASPDTLPEAIELKDPSFEDQNLRSWYFWPGGGQSLPSDSSVSASQGGRYMKMNGVTSQDVTVRPGSKLRFRLDYRAYAKAAGYRITASNNKAQYYEYLSFVTDTQVKKWQTASGIFSMPGDLPPVNDSDVKNNLRLKIGSHVEHDNEPILVDNFVVEYLPSVRVESVQPSQPVQIGSEVEVTTTIHHEGGGALHEALLSVPLPRGVSYEGRAGDATVTLNDGQPVNVPAVEKTDGARRLEIKPGAGGGDVTAGTYVVKYKVRIGGEVDDKFSLKPTLFHKWASADSFDQQMDVTPVDFQVAKSDAQLVEGGFAGVYEKNKDAVLQIPVKNLGEHDAKGVKVKVEPKNGIAAFDANDDCVKVAGGAVECSVGDLAPDAKKTIEVKGRVTGSGVLQAKATVTADSRQMSPREQTYTGQIDNYFKLDLTTVVRHANGDVAKTVEPGEKLTFEAKVTNSGPDAVGGLSYKLVLPKGLASDQPIPAKWDVGTLDSQQSREMKFTATAPADLPEFFYSVLRTSATGQDRSEHKDAEAKVEVNRSAQLEASVSVDRGGAKTDGPLVPNTPVGYTVKIKNSGPSTAQNVVVSQSLPEGFASGMPVLQKGLSYDSEQNKWTVDSIPAGQTVELTLKGRVLPDHSSLTYEAKIEEASIPDSRGAYGEVESHRVSQTSEVTQQAEINVAVARTKPKAEARPGEEVTWNVTASNAGPSIAKGVEIANKLPEGVTLTSAKDEDGKDVALEGNVWKPADLAPGDTATLTVTGTVPADRDTLDFTSSVARSATPDIRGAIGEVPQHKAVNSLKAIQQADLDVTLTPAASGLKPGEKGTVTVTVSNAGPSLAKGTTAELSLPDNLTGITDDGKGTFDAQSGTWKVGDLKVGDEKSLTLTFSSDTEQESTFSVLALASAAEDPNACVDVCASAIAKISKSGEAPAAPGDSGDGAGGGSGGESDGLAGGAEEKSALDQALAATGSNALWLGAGALGAVGVGAALLIAARRRRA